MRRDYRGREAESVEEIVNGDLFDISASDVLLVNAARPSWGTAMEIYFAAACAGRHRLIVTVCPDPKPSPWLIRHSTYIVDTFEKAFEVLQRYQ